MFTAPPVTPGVGAYPDLSASSSRKRKRRTYAYNDNHTDVTDEHQSPLKEARPSISLTDGKSSSPQKSPRKKAKATSGHDAEKRLRRFRKHPPQSYLEIKARALTQRLTVLDRSRCGTSDAPEETVTMAGSTGNVYTQHIGSVPSCDCPHAKKGNQCKHIVYVMLRVLKAPEHAGYQLALTSEELREVFRNAAPIPSADVSSGTAEVEETDGNRKAIEGECPICYTDFEAGREAIVYCKAGCGNNVHKDCMQSWAAAKAGKASCPYCRAKWENIHVGSYGRKVDLEKATTTEEGYVNIAQQLGISGTRDYSSYHQPWVNRQLGRSKYRYRRTR